MKRERCAAHVLALAVVMLGLTAACTSTASPQSAPTSGLALTTISDPPAATLTSAVSAATATVGVSTPLTRTNSSSSEPSGTLSSSSRPTVSSPSSVSSSPALIAPGQAGKLGLRPLRTAVTIKRTAHAVQGLVQLKIHNKPYLFIIDTGASITVIDSTVATAENLAPVGAAGKATTLGCTVPTQLVAISNWSIAGQALPASLLPSQKTDLAGQKVNGIPLGGLLGADVFYLYGTMSLNFTAATLSLGQPAGGGKNSFPIRSQQTKTGGVTIQADLTVHHTHATVAVDTGAAVTEIDAVIAKTAGLTNVGKPTKIGAVSCAAAIQPVTLDRASIGSTPLPTITAVAATNPAPTKTGRQGLLGADLLSTFGVVTFDFVHQKVILG